MQPAWRRVELRRNLEQGRRLQRTEAAQREEGQIGNPFRRQRVDRGIVTPSCADLGDDLQGLRIWEQRLADQPVGDVRAVKVAGVEVVHPRVDGSAQHGPRLIGVARQGLLVPSASKTKLDFRNESLSMVIAGT